VISHVLSAAEKAGAAVPTSAGVPHAPEGACLRLGIVTLAALPDCHAATDFQSLEMQWALSRGGTLPRTTDGTALPGRGREGGPDSAWSEWTTITQRVQDPVVPVTVTDPLRVYRLRLILHSDRRLIGPPTPPTIIDQARSLLGSAVWPVPSPEGDSPSAASTFVPTLRALGSAAFELLEPSELSACHQGVEWAMQWRQVGAALGAGPEHELPTLNLHVPHSTLSRPHRQLHPVADGTHLALPDQGVAIVQRVERASGVVALVAKEIRCPGGCTFRLIPRNLPGWTTPSAETAPIASLPLRRPPRASVFELRFRPAPSSSLSDARQRRLERLLHALMASHGGESLQVLEARFGGEFLVVAIPSSAAARGFVSAWLRLLDDAAASTPADGAADEIIELMQAVDVDGGLLEILADGTAVRRVGVGSEDESASAWKLWLLLCATVAVGLLCAFACRNEEGGARRLVTWLHERLDDMTGRLHAWIASVKQRASYQSVVPWRLGEDADDEGKGELADAIVEALEGQDEREATSEATDGDDELDTHESVNVHIEASPLELVDLQPEVQDQPEEPA